MSKVEQVRLARQLEALRALERLSRRYNMVHAGGTSYLAVEHHGDDR